MASRAYECGKRMGESIVEMAHLFYQLDTKKRFYRGLLEVIAPEVATKINKYDRKRKERAKESSG